MKRKELREIAVRLFYEMDIQKNFNNDFFSEFIIQNNLKDVEDKYINKVFDFFRDNQEQIDNLIQNSSTSWDIKRIAKVDLSILRIATTEIIFMKDIPNKVSINEAIDLGKKYGDENAYKFINGLLGKIVQN